MIRNLALSCLTSSILLSSISCDRDDPDSPIGSLDASFAEQQHDTILIKDPDLKTISDNDEISVIVEEPVSGTVGEPPAAKDPEFVPKTFSLYRINITEMKTSCPGNTVNIERLKIKVGGEFLIDTFASYPNDADPKYNSGKVGALDAKITTSGSYKDFYPFEAFGGGFGAGWWSTQNSFAIETPAPAVIPVWYQISFNQQKVKIDSIFINGGSTALGPEYKPCSPNDFTISGSNDGVTWDVLANLQNQDTESGMEVFLKYPLLPKPQS